MIENEKIIHDDEYYYKIIRKNIKRIRKEKELTQQRLADLSGITRQYLCDIEIESRNKHIPISTLGRIADALDTPITDFFKETK